MATSVCPGSHEHKAECSGSLQGLAPQNVPGTGLNFLGEEGGVGEMLILVFQNAQLKMLQEQLWDPTAGRGAGETFLTILVAPALGLLCALNHRVAFPPK